jgi:hypothetical protein
MIVLIAARAPIASISAVGNWRRTMLSTILVILLILLLLGAVPSWSYSANWGYGPSGLLGIILVIVLILALTGRL